MKLTNVHCEGRKRLVDGFFATPQRRLKRDIFRSVTDLQAAINRFPEHDAGTGAHDVPWNSHDARRRHAPLDH